MLQPPEGSASDEITASEAWSGVGSATETTKEIDSAELTSLLERGMREALREMARTAGDSKAGGAQTLESIVRNVSTRLVKERDASPAPVHSRSKSESKEPVLPMLADLTATPWELWREPASQIRGVRSLNPGRSRLGGSLLPESPPAVMHVDSRRISQVSEACDPSQMFVTPTGRRTSSKDIPLEGVELAVETVFSRQESSARSSAHDPMSPAGMSSPTRLGSKKILRQGLYMGYHSAQHTMMQWMSEQDSQGPRSVFLVAKPKDRVVQETLQDMVGWLSSQGVVTVLEPELLEEHPELSKNLPKVRTFSPADELEMRIDLVITIGGDGTLTWATSRFPNAMPPVLSFAAGSLGFLTPFPLDGWVRTLTRLYLPNPLQPRNLVVCRLRLHVSIHRRGRSSDEGINLQCLNEVLLHRGPAANLCKFDLSVDGEKVTVVQGDGIIVATPTGSTAYSLSAGGSMVHPGVPGMLVTPVSPHSLSFRPAVLPDSADVCLMVPLTARQGASVSVDGKDICMLDVGDSVNVSMSPHPVPTICHTTETADWFSSVHAGLQWNGRTEQK